MEQNKSKVKDLAIGDLVTHVLYGKEWIGIILGFSPRENKSNLDSRSEKTLVQIQPGTKYEGFFKNKVARKDSINPNLGYVTSNWLFKIEIKNENSRPSRNKTSKSRRQNKKIP